MAAATKTENSKLFFLMFISSVYLDVPGVVLPVFVGGLGGSGGNLITIAGLETKVPITLSMLLSCTGGRGAKSGSDSAEDGGDCPLASLPLNSEFAVLPLNIGSV